MTKNVVVPGSPPPLYSHAAGDYRPYPRPINDGQTLLSLDVANASNPAYKYVDISTRYLGGFRVDADPGGYGLGTSRYSRGGIMYNPANNSIFYGGQDTERIFCEYNMATLTAGQNSADIVNLPIATVRQAHAYLLRGAGFETEGSVSQYHCGGYCDGAKVMVNMFGFYQQSASGFTKPTSVFQDANDIASGVVGDWMGSSHPSSATGSVTRIPTEHQAALGGTHICGLSNSTARASTAALSIGPAAYTFNADDVLANSLSGNITFNELSRHYIYPVFAPSEQHLYNNGAYGTAEQRTNAQPLGNNIWTHLSEISFVYVVPGTRTVLMLGGSGMHNSGGWYGQDPNVPEFVNQGHHPVDPDDQYPYYWLVDVNDLAEVFAGTKSPSDVVPYETGVFPAPFQDAGYHYIGGGSVDEATGTVYLTIKRPDTTQGPGAVAVVTGWDFSGI